MMKQILVFFLLTAIYWVWAKPLPIYSEAKSASFVNQEQTLAEIVHSVPGQEMTALLMGADSVAVGVTSDAFSHMRLRHDENNWFVESDSLPPVVNIRNVVAIYLVSESIGYGRIRHLLEGADFLGQSVKNGFLVYKYRVKKGMEK